MVGPSTAVIGKHTAYIYVINIYKLNISVTHCASMCTCNIKLITFTVGSGSYSFFADPAPHAPSSLFVYMDLRKGYLTIWASSALPHPSVEPHAAVRARFEKYL